MVKHEEAFALVGAQTLLGREIRDIGQSKGMRLRGFDTADEEGKTLVRGEDGDLELLPPLDAAAIAAARAVFFVGDAELGRKTLGMGPRVLVDVAGVLEAKPGPRFKRIPSAAALLLEDFAAKVGALGKVERMVAHVLYPVSEWGQAALGELQQQTVALLNFQTMRKELFDTQAAFALLPGYGEESAFRLSEAQARTERELAAMEMPPWSLHFTQAPVFHGLSATVWVEFAKPVAVDAFVWGEQEGEGPNNVNTAGTDGVAYGKAMADSQNGKAAWFWMAADNHRLVANRAWQAVEGLA